MSTLPAFSSLPEAAPSALLRLRRAHLSCEVFRSMSSLERFRDDWDRLAEATGSGVYQSCDWCRAWWEHYGRRREPRVFIFRDGDDLAGVAPFCIDRVRLGPVTLRIAKIMGSDHTQGICNLPLRPTWAETAFDELLQRLVNDERCDAVHFGPLTGAGTPLEALRSACACRPDLVSLHRDRVVTQHSTIELPDTFDAYLRSLSRNQRANNRKDLKRLRADFDVKVETVTDPEELTRELHEFARMHATQWASTGRLGHFRDWPDAEGFNRTLVRAMGRRGRVCFLRLRADDRVVARQFALLFGDTCHCRFAARAPGRRWRQYGLGRVSLIKLIEHMIERGVRRIDAGTGRYDYKTRLGGDEHDVRSILVVANRDASRSRTALFTTLADLLDRFYYRYWYCRIAPRLPGAQRPLRRIWIRSRF